MRRGQLGGRRRQYLRGKRQLPCSHHSAAGCVSNVQVWICVSGENEKSYIRKLCQQKVRGWGKIWITRLLTWYTIT